jgi:hypothetical protein
MKAKQHAPDVEGEGWRAGYRRLEIIDERKRIERAQAVAKYQQQHLAMTSHQLYHSSQGQTLSRSPQLVQTLLPNVFQNNVFLSFLIEKIYESQGRLGIEDIGSDHDLPLAPLDGCWIDEMVRKGPSKSLEALAAMFFGQVHDLHKAKVDALKLYDKALAELRANLSNPTSPWNFDILAATTALCMYEVLLPSSSFGVQVC